MKDQYKTKKQLIEELEALRKEAIKLRRTETKRKQNEEALRESEERYRIITDYVDDIVWQLDLRLHFVYVSPAVERVLGYTPQEARGLYVVDLLDEDGLVRMREVIQNRSDRETDFSMPNEYRMRHKDGHWVDVEVLSSSLFDAEGHPTGFVGITRDIGVRKRAEEALRTAETRYRIVADNTYDWEFWRSPEGRFLYNSPSCKWITGYAPDEFTADPDLLYRIIHPDDRPDFDRHKDEMTQKMAPYEVEFRVIRPDGTVRWIGHACQPVFAPDGHFLGTRGSNRDITERKRAEGRLERLNECLVSFGSDPIENINRLVAFCGEQLKGTCALYNRLENGLLHSVGQWNTPPDFASVDKPEGHICFDLIQSDSSEVCVIRNLQQTTYAQTDSNVSCYNLKTYIGKTVSFGDTIIGSLCVVFQEDYIPSEDDKNFLGIVASAIGVEEKRRHAEDALLFTRFSLDNAVETMVYVDRDARFIDVNDAFCRSSGYSREELLSMTVHDIDPDYSAEIWPEFWEKLKQSGSLTFETCHRSKEGRIFPVEIIANFFEHKGKEYHCGFARDITERKRAEEEAVRNTKNMEFLSETAMGFVEFPSENDIYRFIGEQLKQLVDEAVYVLVNSIDRTTRKTQLRALLTDDQSMQVVSKTLGVDPMEMSFILSEEAWNNLLIGRLVHVPGGIHGLSFGEIPKAVCDTLEKVAGIGKIFAMGFAKKKELYGNAIIIMRKGSDLGNRDVVETFVRQAGVALQRKRAEEALLESEAKYRRLYESMMDAYAKVDMTGQIQEFNPTFREMLDYSDEELRRLTYEDLTPGKWHDFEVHILEEQVQVLGYSQVYEKEYQRKDGTIFPVELRTFLMRDQSGRPEGMWAIIRDITERKCIEVALRESEENFRALAENANDGILIAIGEEGCHVYANRRAVEITGYPIEELLKTRLRDLAQPDELPKLAERYKKRLAGIEVLKPYETVLLNKDGIKVPIEISPSKTTWQNQPADIVIFRDITERKRREEALRETQELLISILDNAPMLIYVTSHDNRYRLVNKAWETFVRLPREEAVGRLIEQVFSPKTACQFMEANQQVIDMRIPVVTEEFVDRSDGPYHFHTVKFPLRDTTSKVTSVGGISFDITERKRAEEALRRKSGEQALLLDNIQTQVWYLTDKETYGTVNKVRAEFFGKNKEEMENKKVYDVLTKNEAEICISGYAEVFEKGKQIHTEEWIGNAKGEKRLLSIIKSPKLDENGEVEYVVCSAEDITERKRAEKERDQLFEQVHASRERLRNLTRRLVEVQEVERRGLVRKLHDEVGQSLTALSINLNIVHNQLPPETATKMATRIDDSLKLVEETVERIRDVMAELRPPVLDDYGLMAALNWYSKQFSERMGIATVVEGEELMPRLPLATETAFYRIAQEALTNVTKHSKAKQVSIALKTINKKVSLTIIDDGVGFDPEVQQQQQQQPDWGLINMRERAQAVGGTLMIESAPGKGTKVIVEIPRNY